MNYEQQVIDQRIYELYDVLDSLKAYIDILAPQNDVETEIVTPYLGVASYHIKLAIKQLELLYQLSTFVAVNNKPLTLENDDDQLTFTFNENEGSFLSEQMQIHFGDEEFSEAPPVLE